MIQNCYTWKRTAILIECEKGPKPVDFYCHPDTKTYALRDYWDYHKHETRWEIWNLLTMQRIGFGFGEMSDAIEFVVKLLNRVESFADVSVDEIVDGLEEKLLAMKPLPDRLMNCVNQLKALFPEYGDLRYGR